MNMGAVGTLGVTGSLFSGNGFRLRQGPSIQPDPLALLGSGRRNRPGDLNSRGN